MFDADQNCSSERMSAHFAQLFEMVVLLRDSLSQLRLSLSG